MSQEQPQPIENFELFKEYIALLEQKKEAGELQPYGIPEDQAEKILEEASSGDLTWESLLRNYGINGDLRAEAKTKLSGEKSEDAAA